MSEEPIDVIVSVVKLVEPQFTDLLGEDVVMRLASEESEDTYQNLVNGLNFDLQAAVSVVKEIAVVARELIIIYLALRTLLERPPSKKELEGEYRKKHPRRSPEKRWDKTVKAVMDILRVKG